ncbi:(+)-caryolan-1-ol synthase [compost metagenome]
MDAAKQGRELVADYELPEVPCGVPPRINTCYPTIRERHAAWVYQFVPPLHPGTLQRGIAQMDAMYDSLVFPDGVPERVCNHACLTTMIIDCDDLAQLKTALFDQIAEGQASDPHSLAFADVWSTFRKNAPTEALYRRIRSAWRDWLDAVATENRLRRGGNVPDVETVLHLRQTSVGLRPYFIAVEYVLDADLSDITQDPDALRAVEAGITHIELVNDLYSYRKEYFHDDSINTVAALRRFHGFSLQDAIDRVYGRLHELNRELEALTCTLSERYARHPDGTRARQCFDAYRSLVAGNVQWHLETPRYNGRGYVWDGRRSRRITSDSILAPVDPL